MQEESLQRFLISVRCERFVDYLDPIGETAEEALTRRIRWARMTRNDPAHADEAMFLLQHEDALREVLESEQSDAAVVESVEAGQENGESAWSRGAETTELSPLPEEPDNTEEDLEGPSGIMTLEDLHAESEVPTVPPAMPRVDEPTEPMVSVDDVTDPRSPAWVNDGSQRPTPVNSPGGSGGHVGLLQPRGLVRTASPPGPRVNSPTLSTLSSYDNRRSATPTILPPDDMEEDQTPVPGMRVDLPTEPGVVLAQFVDPDSKTPLMTTGRPKPIRPPISGGNKEVVVGGGMMMAGLVGVGVLAACVGLLLLRPFGGTDPVVPAGSSSPPVVTAGPTMSPSQNASAAVARPRTPAVPDAVPAVAPVVVAPASATPDAAPVAPDPVPVPDPVSVVADSVPAAPDPVPAAPDPVPAAPDPVPAVPDPVPAVPDPVPAVPAPVVAEPTPVAPASVPVAPDPEPTASAPSLMGLWGGSVGDRPLLLRIQGQDGASFSGKAEILEGSGRWSRHNVSGVLNPETGMIQFQASEAGVSFSGTLKDSAVSGSMKQDGESFPVSVTR